MQTTQEPRKNIFQHAWRNIRRLFANNITENAAFVSPPPPSSENIQTTALTHIEKAVLSAPNTSSPTHIDIAIRSNANQAAALLEPFNSVLLKQFSMDDVYTLKKGLERKLALGLSTDYIERQLQHVMETYTNTPNINDVLNCLADICGVEALKLSQRATPNHCEKSLQSSIRLFNKKFSRPCELTQKQCLSLPPNVLPMVLDHFEATRRFMQNNGILFEQIKWLAESPSGQLKLEILLNDDSGLIKLMEHDIAFERLAELNLHDFKTLLTGTNTNKYMDFFSSQPVHDGRGSVQDAQRYM